MAHTVIAAANALEVLVFLVRPSAQEVLLLRRCREHGGFWHGVAGAVEHGETPEAAAIRELREEVGLDAEALLGAARHDRYRYRRLSHGLHGIPITVCVDCYCLEIEDEFVSVLNYEHDIYEWCEPPLADGRLRWRNAATTLRRFLA